MKCGDVNTYVEWYHEEVYVSKQIEVDMLLLIRGNWSSRIGLTKKMVMMIRM